jgi:hypothetical protein
MRTYHRSIVFSKISMKGCFIYKDIFQLFPADDLDGIPTTKVHQKHHPLILEYWTEKDEITYVPSDFDELKDLYSLTALTTTKQDIILSLLTTITNHVFFRYTEFIGNWGLPILKEDVHNDEVNAWESKWCLPLFVWKNFQKQLKIERFSQINYPNVDFIPHEDYYFNNPNFDYSFDKHITFPNTSIQILDSYYSQPKDILEVINSAISFSNSAMELRNSKKTLSLISAFTSIETLVNMEFENTQVDKCKDCGQLKYKISEKYRQFLFKYIGKSNTNKKKFNSYYSLRSKIVHTGQKLKTEKLFSYVSEEKSAEEFLNQIEIIQLAKLSIINWLIQNKKNK